MFKSGLFDGHNHPLRAALGNDRDAPPTAGDLITGVVYSSLMALGVAALSAYTFIEADKNASTSEMGFSFRETAR